MKSKICHDTTKNVRHDVKNMSWRQIVCHDVKNMSWRQIVCHDVKNTLWRQKYVMTSKICHDVKRFIMTSQSSSWRQKVGHDVKNTSWSKIVTEQCYATLKSLRTDTHTDRHTASIQPLPSSTNKKKVWMCKIIFVFYLEHSINKRLWNILRFLSCSVWLAGHYASGCPTVRHTLRVPLCVHLPAKAMTFQQIIMHVLQCDVDVHLLLCFDLDIHLTCSQGHV